MNGLEQLDVIKLRSEQLWYVAHPVHPTKAEVDEGFRQLRGYVGGSPGTRELREIQESVVRRNLDNAKLWLAWLIRRYPTVTFIAPWIASLDGGGDDDLDPAQRARGIRDCRRTIRVCCGMVLVGGRVSDGMTKERECSSSTVDLTYLGRSPPPTCVACRSITILTRDLLPGQAERTCPVCGGSLWRPLPFTEENT